MIDAKGRLKRKFYNGRFIELHSGDVEEIEKMIESAYRYGYFKAIRDFKRFLFSWKNELLNHVITKFKGKP